MSLSGIDGVLFILFPFSTAQVDVLSDEFINSINKAQSFWRAGKVWPENTTSEFLERLSGSVDPNLYRHEYEDQIAHRPQFRLDANIPEAFDVREKWPQCKAIDKERSQGFCNSCWAHVVASAFTDIYCIASKGETNFEFSTEDILTCCGPECLADAARSCTGGRVDKAWDYLVEQGGVSGGEYKSREVK
ncbi:Peptidase C1 and/or Propeptide C1 domain containing protein [Asbolus verrucosus]|uniref:Peptidase C1 and/or Propeptide C1 domain containing protein n=1 Tax=Asbolus verrucosus TaxID=1661398 RepID=A0A482VDT9_ASBVE|nr:Peptidase C1 and/or Propeptide C1 domain containing protein [Asbolus verrucosus]